MSAAPRVILLDSNAYFRLALSISPLLAKKFGNPPPYQLKVIDEVEKEYARNPRLKSKFHWLCDHEHVADRSAHTYHCRGKVATQVDAAFSFLANYASANALNLSRVDIKALAVGAARGIPVVTDDQGMRRLAEVFAISIMGALELLKLMVNEQRIDLEKVREVLEYWHHDDDLPAPIARLRDQYRTLFDKKCPI